MAVVNLRTFWQSLGDTGEKELSGLLEATPWAGRSAYVHADGEKVVVGGRTKVQICDSVPETTIELKPTEGKFAWKLSLTLTNYSKTIERFVEIPDVDNIDWADLIDVDPITYEPSLEGIKAWEIALQNILLELRDHLITAFPDPQDEDILIISYPAYMQDPDNEYIINIPIKE